MINVIMLSVVMLNVIMPSVMAPVKMAGNFRTEKKSILTDLIASKCH
jgi:hypothetical protein